MTGAEARALAVKIVMAHPGGISVADINAEIGRRHPEMVLPDGKISGTVRGATWDLERKCSDLVVKLANGLRAPRNGTHPAEPPPTVKKAPKSRVQKAPRARPLAVVPDPAEPGPTIEPVPETVPSSRQESAAREAQITTLRSALTATERERDSAKQDADRLGQAIAEAAMRARVLSPHAASLSGSQLVALCDEMASAILASRETPGAIIKKARAAAKLTQPGLAARFGVTRSTVANWENGQYKPSKAILAWAREMSASTHIACSRAARDGFARIGRRTLDNEQSAAACAQDERQDDPRGHQGSQSVRGSGSHSPLTRLQ